MNDAAENSGASIKTTLSSFNPPTVAGPAYPRPTNGIWFAITVMNSTFVESGRFAM